MFWVGGMGGDRGVRVRGHLRKGLGNAGSLRPQSPSISPPPTDQPLNPPTLTPVNPQGPIEVGASTEDKEFEYGKGSTCPALGPKLLEVGRQRGGGMVE